MKNSCLGNSLCSMNEHTFINWHTKKLRKKMEWSKRPIMLSMHQQVSWYYKRRESHKEHIINYLMRCKIILDRVLVNETKAMSRSRSMSKTNKIKSRIEFNRREIYLPQRLFKYLLHLTRLPHQLSILLE